MERLREFQRSCYIIFINLRKAYDSVNRAVLWNILQRAYSIPVKLINIIQALHNNTRASIRAYGKNSPEFDVGIGVWLGCVMAPVLFNLFFDVVTKLALQKHQQKHQQKGISLLYHLDEQKLVGGHRKFINELLLNNLMYADDIALLTDSKSDLEDMLRSFDSTCPALGLTVSTSETKLMTVLPPGQADPTVPVPLYSGEADIPSC